MCPSDRKYLLERPSHAEVEETLWRMVFDARRREEELKRELKDRNDQWLKQERNLRDWEHHLDVRERQIDNKDDSVSKMMKDLRIKDDMIDSQNDEIRGLKREMDERVYRAGEEHDREWQVGVICDSYLCVSIVVCLGV